MEALWSLEEKFKITTKEAVVILVGTIAAITLLCTIAAFINRNSRGKQVADAEWASMEVKEVKKSCKWSKVKTTLMGSFCWSSATKWEEKDTEMEQRTQRLLGAKERSFNAVDPVWKRPILMGEKCEFPRFSGLILYDERGHQIHQHPHQEQVQHIPLVRTTLRDLL